MAINEIVLTVSIIFLVKNGNVIGSASGFFYSRGDKLFLVTNQHVMRDEQKGVFPDKLRLRLHTDVNNTGANDDFEVELYSANKPLWKFHPQFKNADVALIELDAKKLKQKFLIKTWSKDSFLPKNYRLDPGEDVFVMGYPLAFYDTPHNLPIFRNAMIASTFRVNFRNHPLFLTDANLHEGTSGSPVITKPKSTWIDDSGNTNFLTGTVYYLVGVHSGTVDKSITGDQEIGLGAAWYAELIEDIASLF
jgi:S1-C subfamily serine protease